VQPNRLLEHAAQPLPDTANRLADLILGNLAHPARELMWGSPGTLLAALFLHQRTGDARWAELFRTTATMLWSQLLWSEEFGCHYWTQDLYGEKSTYIDAVHGFVATAVPLIHGRHLLTDAGCASAIASTPWLVCLRCGNRKLQGDEGSPDPPAWAAPCSDSESWSGCFGSL
jgi:hypothetical protein